MAVPARLHLVLFSSLLLLALALTPEQVVVRADGIVTTETQQQTPPSHGDSVVTGEYGDLGRPLVRLARFIKPRLARSEALIEKSKEVVNTGQDRRSSLGGHKVHAHTEFDSASTFPLAVSVMVLMVVAMYSRRGWVIVVKVNIYLIALSSMTLGVKYVYMYNFIFAKFVTACHLLLSCLVGFVVLVVQRRYAKEEAKFVVPSVELFAGIVPCALCFAASLAFNNMALVLCSASFTQVFASSSPIVTVGFVIAMGMPFDMKLIFPLLLVFAGCFFTVEGEMSFSLLGSLLCFFANVTRSMRTAIQQKLLTRNGNCGPLLEPVALMTWTCAISFVIMIMWSLCSEGLAPWRALVDPTQSWSFHAGLYCALFASCVNACILNTAQLFVTKDIGAVGTQVIGQLKSIATVIGGMALFGDHFSTLESVGFACILVGSGVYSHMQKPAQPNSKSPPPLSAAHLAAGDVSAAPVKPVIPG